MVVHTWYNHIYTYIWFLNTGRVIWECPKSPSNYLQSRTSVQDFSCHKGLAGVTYCANHLWQSPLKLVFVRGGGRLSCEMCLMASMNLFHVAVHPEEMPQFALWSDARVAVRTSLAGGGSRVSKHPLRWFPCPLVWCQGKRRLTEIPRSSFVLRGTCHCTVCSATVNPRILFFQGGALAAACIPRSDGAAGEDLDGSIAANILQQVIYSTQIFPTTHPVGRQ